ncbi:MAG TPA: hypothetical protein RMH99_04115, partial [Sandaracinaceae bacterium LLY-WYZ-13_1]|nr:hypothetical protein [Sandaracinaceae bacterium LLY-WYZ-13_1]
DAGEGGDAGRCDRAPADFVSPNDGTVGVDNAMQQVVGTIDGLLGVGQTYAGQLAARIAAGDLLLGIELRGTDPVGAALVVLAPSDPIALGADGRLAPGQRFEVVERLGDGAGALGEDGRARVALGDLRRPLDELAPAIEPTDPADLWPAPFREVELRFDEGVAGLTGGELGALVTVDEMVGGMSPLTTPGVGHPREVLEDLADLRPSAADPTVCAAISLGFAFEAVPASFE